MIGDFITNLRDSVASHFAAHRHQVWDSPTGWVEVVFLVVVLVPIALTLWLEGRRRKQKR